MKIISSILTAICLMLVGCSSHSDDAYTRLLELAGINDSPQIRRLEFIKTSGMDPYYLAKIEVELQSISEVPNLFAYPSKWKISDDRYVAPPREVEWWRPQDLESVKIWTPKERDVPSYTEILAGTSGSKIVIYLAWMSHHSF